MSISAKEQFKLRKLIRELAQCRGRHTELVTVYVPAGYELVKIIGHLQQEQGTATNIKSASTRKNVIDALERMIQHLRLFKKTPENGLAVFSGNVSEREGQSDVQVWSFEPPAPLNIRIYRCDKTFVLEHLEDMLETKEVYGLVVLDRRDAMIALLKGKSIVPLVKTHSEVPGKMRAGGQCLTKDTLIQIASGDILKIAKSHNPLYVKSMGKDYSIKDSPITGKWSSKKIVYKIITKNPRLEVTSSKDHVFFVRKDRIEELPAEKLREGDYLLMPEIIDVKGSIQKLKKKNFVSYVVSKKGLELIISRRKAKELTQNTLAKKAGLAQVNISAFERGIENRSEKFLKSILKELSISFSAFKPYLKEGKAIRMPDKLTPEVAQIVGYWIGDGHKEKERVTFFEQREEVANYYANLMKKVFAANITQNFRKSKNYHQIRLYGKPIADYLGDNFPEVTDARTSSIPIKILESPLEVVAAFLKGLYDAEGYPMRGKVGIGMNNKEVIQALQMLLLRFSIISSFLEYDNRRNRYSDNPRFTLEISEKESLEAFRKHIGFASKEKKQKLCAIITKKTDKSLNRQILPLGREIRKVIEAAGYNLELFPKVGQFFNNNRKMGKASFKKSVISCVKDKKLQVKLQKIVDMPILPVEIMKIVRTKEKADMIDISVKDKNFIANGLIVHNSSQRFERLTEGAVVDHFKKIAEYMKEQFLNMPNLKGIMIGGPGTTVNNFFNKHYVTGDVEKKIIAIKDLSYTDEFGLQELVDKSQDVLASEAIAAEKKIMQRFLELLAKKPGMVTYGEAHVRKAIEAGAVDVLLLSEELDDDTLEELQIKAEELGSKTEIISTETREGVQLRDIGKVAAILRFEFEG